jgi:SAM-dependent methyltransferase
MTVAAITSQLLRRQSKGIDERHEALGSAMESLGWSTADVNPLTAKAPGYRLLELSAGSEPQALLVVSSGAQEQHARSVALGYSREAPYTLWWSGSKLALSESRRWRQHPGDIAVGFGESSANQEAVIELLRRDSLLNREPSLYISEGEEHDALHERLAKALATLRQAAAQHDAFRGRDHTEQDNAVLRLFHQLLFVRFQEDWGRSPSDRDLASLLDSSRPQGGLSRILRQYRRLFDSELFEDAGVVVDELPASSLRGVLKSLVEPWHLLQLNFSVSRTEIASRLYQSYLKLAPSIVDETETLFPIVSRVDEREIRASYYTPLGLAEYLCEKTLGGWLDDHKPQKPSEVRILDPACGSGTFLLAAFRTLEEYFRRLRDRSLTNRERLEIVTESLFGADIDERAVGLARIQLLELASVDERGPLPDLRNNLIVGDSLLSAPGEEAPVNAVDWDAVSAGRPFDVVLANPPFGSQLQLPARLGKADREAARARFPEVRAWGSDYAYLFLALTLRLTDKKSRVGFVLPEPALEGRSGRAARAAMLDRGVSTIVDFRGLRLFDNGAYVVAVTLGGHDEVELIDVPDSRDGRTRILDDLKGSAGTLRQKRVPLKSLAKAMADGWTPFGLRWTTLIKNISREVEPLAPPGGRGEKRLIVHGTQPGAARLCVRGDEWECEGGEVLFGGAKVPLRYFPELVRGRSIRPFALQGDGDKERLLVPFENDGTLSTHSGVLSALDRLGGLPTNAQPGDLRTLRSSKLLIRRLSFEPAAVLDITGKMMIQKGSGGGLALHLPGAEQTMAEGVEALFHSSLYQWLLRGFGRAKHDESIELHLSDVAALPWPVEIFEAEWRELAVLGAAIHAALRLETDIRLLEYWDAREKVDDLVFEMFGVTRILKQMIGDELLRRG